MSLCVSTYFTTSAETIVLLIDSLPLQMSRVWKTRVMIALTLALTLVLMGTHVIIKFRKFSVATEPPPSCTRNKMMSQLKVVQPGSLVERTEIFNCTQAQLSGMKFPICIYPAATDIYISRVLLNGNYFDGHIVSRFLQTLKRDRRLQFVDIGANIGVYSLPAARVTQVLAVEPNWRSMARLARAVHLGSVTSNITLVHNAVSDVCTKLNMGVDSTNQGHAFLINATRCTATLAGKPCNVLSQTSTVLLNDLLPLMRSTAALLKVDVEGHEINVFTESSAGQFFDQVDVRLVFMEWVFCKKQSPTIIERLLNFFYARNYTVCDLRNCRLQQHYRDWPENVLFKKLTYINDNF